MPPAWHVGCRRCRRLWTWVLAGHAIAGFPGQSVSLCSLADLARCCSHLKPAAAVLKPAHRIPAHLQVGRTFNFASRSSSINSQRSGVLNGLPVDPADVSDTGSISSSTAATPRGGAGDAAMYQAPAIGSAAMRAALARASTASAGVADPQSLAAAQAQVAALRDEKAALAAEKAEAETALVAARAQLEELLSAARNLHSRATVAEESKSVASQVRSCWAWREGGAPAAFQGRQAGTGRILVLGTLASLLGWL